MHRPSYALLLAGLALLGACSEPTDPGRGEDGGGPAEGRAPRHVLLVVIDTLRADHLSCYGYWRETSPNIDSLARRGVRFEQHISQSSWTAPSMITMLTGQRLSGPRLDVPEDKPTLAELFKDAGYATGAWVGNPLLTAENGYARGFDVFVDEQAWHATTPPGLLDDALRWLHENRDRDTFTWIHFTDPHDPYTPPADARSDTPGRLSEDQRSLIAEVAATRPAEGEVAAETDFIAAEVGLYDDEIVTVDRKVRRLVSALAEDGNLDGAVVVVTSDHGETLWQRAESDRRLLLRSPQRHGPLRVRHLFKQTHGDFVFQELVRVPLIVVAPGLERGRVIEEPLEALHLPATILDLAGVDVEGAEQLAGKSLFADDVPRGAYTMTKLGEAFVSPDGWKLILPTAVGVEDFGYEVQLYDLGADPRERENLAAARPDKVAELTSVIEERRAASLPRLTAAEARQRELENMQALKALGYTESGIVDPAAEGELGGGDHADH